MANFLRTGKFFRFLSAGKNLVNFREYEAAHQLPPSCICSTQNFATISAQLPTHSLENSLRRLDQDAKKSGRISRRDLEEILEEIRTSKAATSSQSLLVIRCCGNLVAEEMPEVRTKLVQEIWKTLSKLNVPMDVSHYNALLRVYLENEYNFSPTEFLADLQSKGVEPNRVTYQRLIARYCQQGDVDGATQILEFMREKQLPVNENVFNSLIAGHSNAEDLESAVGVLSVMSHSGMEPSADTYTTLLCGFARNGDIESINKYMKQCEEKEIYLLDKDRFEVVYALAVNGHGDKVDALLDQMRKGLGYNQDAVNLILRLINRGQEAVGLKVLKTMVRGTRATGELADTGNFLIKQLVKANRPAEQIFSICNELEENNMNSRPFSIAVEASLSSKNPALMKTLLREMQTRGSELRPHYFWPVFAATKAENEILELCTSVQNDFKIPLTNQTIRDYVVPRILVGDNYRDVIQKLRNLGVNIATAASTVAYTALKNSKIQAAAEIMNLCEAYYSPGLFRKILLNAFATTKDYESYVKILRHVHDHLGRAKIMNVGQKQELEEEVEEVSDVAAATADGVALDENRLRKLQTDVLGDLVMDAVAYFKTDRVEVTTKILQGLVDQGLTISSHKAEIIQDRIGEGMTTEISTLLGRLTSGELEPIAVEKQRMQRTSGTGSQEDIEYLENTIRRMEEKGENTKGIKRQLLVAAIRARKIEKAQEIVERLKAEGYTLTAGVYAQLVEMYASADKLEEALEALKQIRTIEADFNLDEFKTVKVVQAFVNADRMDEAVKFIEENKLKEGREEKQFNYQSTVWRLLNSLAEKGKAVELNRIFDALVANSYIVPNNVLLGPLVKVHVVNDELKQAVNKFEEISQKYRSTPWKNELACRLIQAEDAENLQRITDLSTDIHGEVNSLYDLVFAFIECGRVRQARKILETPGLRTRPARIDSACERYLSESMPKALEGLAEATKDLSYIDRAGIYNTLLQTYINEEAPEKALNLWTNMQEESIVPSEDFLTKLANFLDSKGFDVPFQRPQSAQHANVSAKNPAEKVIEKKPARSNKQGKSASEQKEFTPTVTALKAAIKSENADEILKAKQSLLPTDKISLHDRSNIVEALVRSERLNEATKVVVEVLEDNLTPLPSIFNFYLNRVAAAGDSETLSRVGSYLSPEKKKVVSFDNRMCHSFVVGGKSDDYLSNLEKTIDAVKTEEEAKKAEEEFPRGGANGILENNPESSVKFQIIAEKYAAKKIFGPMNVLWMHYFINNDTRADDIFKTYLANAPRVMFQRVVQIGRKNQDDKLIKNLVKVLQEAKVSEGALGNAYSCLIDIQVAKNDPDGCLSAINDSIKAVCLENINRTALLRAKDCVEASNAKFPHSIPEKKTTNQQESSSSSSSSSSDEEVTQKKAS